MDANERKTQTKVYPIWLPLDFFQNIRSLQQYNKPMYEYKDEFYILQPQKEL